MLQRQTAKRHTRSSGGARERIKGLVAEKEDEQERIKVLERLADDASTWFDIISRSHMEDDAAPHGVHCTLEAAQLANLRAAHEEFKEQVK